MQANTFPKTLRTKMPLKLFQAPRSTLFSKGDYCGSLHLLCYFAFLQPQKQKIMQWLK
ncbi:hypothetical protein DPMN_180078 [Dreissena polymorpha]|uniref:Uncharacterized protein n=1 Tax=Dreissena polymorpha TaxID=45954 RepID=A0A9D4IMT2_DREPO|nr:hypothetical protein DPMN_180078 [Dreissena polymorpha]